jgi:hypothetical protein
MGEFIRHQGEELFVPEYRITFGFAMLPTTTRIVRVQGSPELFARSGHDATVINAIHRAEIMLMLDEAFPAGALNVGPKVVKVERESGPLKPWEEIVPAFRVTKGMEIQIITDGEPEWVIFRRWDSMGDGYAEFVDSTNRRLGGYLKQHVFVTR